MRVDTSTPSQEHTLYLVRLAMAWTRALQCHHRATTARGSLLPSYFVEDTQGRVDVRPAPADADPIELMQYMPPEQIGKLPLIDVRSDLYSLGAMFYSFWAHTPPFPSDNPLSLAHCHLAIVPEPLALKTTIPQPLSALVDRLLAKLPEARYASTEGLLHDLRECERHLLATGSIPPFELGGAERGAQFLIPAKLYGRDQDVADLEQIYRRAVNGEIVLCLVSGYSGIGKSSLVQALRPHVLATGGDIVEGKYDQYQRAMPYSAIIEAFRGLLRRLHSRTQEEIARSREQILALVGDSGSVLTNVLPELSQIIGLQPPVPELTGAAAQTRFNTLFTSLLKEFASPTHPLVLFLDDLQWADSSSLTLIHTFVQEGVGAHLLLIGAYRDNEVGPTHQLTALIASLRTDQALLAEFVVQPLREIDISHMIADSLYRLSEPERLARYVMDQTHGNPFFTRQFLANMVRQQELTYDRAATCWQWHTRQDPAETHGDVIQLMHSRLSLHTPLTRQLMKAAACLGKHFQLPILAHMLRLADAAALTALAPVLREELILPVDNAPHAYEFRFAHDRVQQAAYTLPEGPSVHQLHLTAGLSLRALTPPEGIPATVFRIVDQFNLALSLITDPSLRIEIARLNLLAAERAHTAMAYTNAQKYLSMAVTFLPADPWDSHYALAYQIHLALAENTSVLSEDDAFQKEIALLLAQAATPLDRLRVRIRQTIHVCQSSQMQAGLSIGCQALAEVGLALPPPQDLPAIQTRFDLEMATLQRQVPLEQLRERLVALPAATDPMAEHIHRLIGAMGDAATIMNTPLLSLLAAIGTNISLQYGHTLLSPLMYTLLGQGLIANRAAYGEARQLAELATELWEQRGQDGWVYGRMRVHQIWFVLHWSQHNEGLLELSEDALEITKKAHDPIYGGYLLNVMVIIRASLGASTQDILDAHQRVVHHCQPFPAMEVIVGFTQCYAAMAAALRGETASLTSLDGAHVTDDVFLARYQALPMVLGLRQGARVPLLGLAGRWTEVLAAVDAPEIAASPPFIPHRLLQFWRGLACASLETLADGESRTSYRNGLMQAIATLETHAAITAENIAHRLQFLRTELERLHGHIDAATHGYRQAITLAGRGGFLIDEAYFCERLADWLAQQNQPLPLRIRVLHEARSGYLQAQAYALLQRVDQKLQDLGVDPQAPDDGPVMDLIDSQAMWRVLRVLNQQPDLAQLLPILLRLIIEFSGADRGAILLREHDQLTIDYARGLAHINRLPATLAHYVFNSGDTVALDIPDRQLMHTSPVASHDFGDLSTVRAASVLCMPIDHRHHNKRALYLQFSTLTKDRWPARQDVLTWLITQAAIAIDHAEMYTQLEQRVQERTLALLTANDQLRQHESELILGREKAEQVAQANAKLLATMSHEIRTPLAGIIGLADVATLDPTPDRMRDTVHKIQRTSHHLITVLNEILDFSQLESGKAMITPVAFSLDHVFRVLKDMALDRTSDKGLELVWQIDPDVPRRLIGDSMRISQALLNYLNNALRHTNQGEIVIRVSVERRQADRILLRWAVRDTGSGIDPAQQERLFHAYAQEPCTPHLIGTTGLGLVISKQYAALMGGTVGLQSAPGQGSTFWLTTACGIGDSHADSHLLTTIQGRSILLLEPHRATRESLASNLRAWNLQVIEAASGQAAMAALSARRPQGGQSVDLAILSTHLPDMAAMELVAWGAQTGDLTEDRIIWLQSPLADSSAIAKNLAPFILGKPVLAFDLLNAMTHRLGHTVPTRYMKNPTPATAALHALAPFHGAHILVTDDTAMNREVAISLLEMAGLRADAAEHGAQAVAAIMKAAAAHDPYAAVLMDWQMPVMDGPTAAMQIRDHADWGQLPIIALTAYALPETLQHCTNAGMNDLITKPFSPEQLWATLARWLSPNAAAIPATAPASPPVTKQPPDDATLVRALTAIRGLHCLQSTTYIPGKEWLYLQTLVQFVGHYQQSCAALSQATAAGQWSAAAHALHQLGGINSISGATTIAALALTIEQTACQLTDGSPAPMVERAIHHLQEEQDRLIRDIVETLESMRGPEVWQTYARKSSRAKSPSKRI
ncbi:MAG: Putative Histidine kinase [Nitrospira sp.]|nr:MAG: Putative Histidine kinase [Nitrospira sp.]